MQLIEKVNSGTLTFEDFNDKKYRPLLNNSNLLGKGAVGKVYLVDGKAIKEVTPCKAKLDSPLYKYCLDIAKAKSQNILPKIPGGYGKHRYMLPNLLSEILIGMILDSPFFVHTTSSYIEENNIYIVMNAEKKVITNNRLNPELKININNPQNFIYMLFQVSHTIMTAQEKYRFTHYDLHIENILWNNWEEGKKYLSYPLPNDGRLIIEKKNCPFILKISDFALARLENKKAIISPSIDSFPVKSYGEFHPSYDIVSFIGSILIDNKYRKYFSSVFTNLDLYRFMLLFTLWILNDNEIRLDGNLERVRDAIGNKYFTKIGTVPNKFNFRPIKEGDFITYSKTKNMTQIVSFLSQIMLRKKYAVKTSVKTSDMIYVKRYNYKNYDKVLTYTPDIAIENIPGRQQSVGDYEEMIIDKNIKVRTYHFLANVEPKLFNFTIENEQIYNCPIQEHYMTAIFVKQGHGYKFGFDCCKLDPANYLLETNKLGFIINGSFFAIKEDFLPIGHYEDKHSIINRYPLPEEYRNVYRYITLNNNKLEVKKNYVKGEEVFNSGPVLIENGEIVFNPRENRFACTDEKHAGNTILALDEDTITVSGYYKYKSVKTEDGFSCVKEFVPDVQTYPRCDKIKPAELSHADNPNPRSAFCILANGDYIFLTVEGRAKRGVGFDLYSLARTIKKSFPDVITVINLDGGRSSNIAWRSTLYPDKVFISNPDHTYPYPVGNILSLTKEK